MTDEIKIDSIEYKMMRLCELTEERAELVESKDAYIAKLRGEIVAECVAGEKTIKTPFGTVTFRRGGNRTSWNSKQLEGLALVYPEINECKKTTETAANAAIKLDV